MKNTIKAPLGESFNLADYINYSDDSVVSKTLIDKGIGNITLFSFDVGQGLSEHTSPFDAVVHVLDGEAEIIIGGQTHIVKSGEMIIMPSNISHTLNARKRFKMNLIMIRVKNEDI